MERFATCVRPCQDKGGPAIPATFMLFGSGDGPCCFVRVETVMHLSDGTHTVLGSRQFWSIVVCECAPMHACVHVCMYVCVWVWVGAGVWRSMIWLFLRLRARCN